MTNNLSFSYTAAALVAILGSFLTVLAVFWLHLTQDNIHSVTLVAGIVLGTIAAGGGAKDAALIRATVKLPGWLHFTGATLVSLAGAGVTVLLSFGFHATQQNIDSVLTLVSLVAAGIVGGGAQVSAAAIRAGTHPSLKNRTVSG